MAASDDEFMRELDKNEAAAVMDNAAIWNHLIAFTQGKAQYVPFNQLSTSNQFNSVAGATRNALEDARALSGSSAGAFEGSYDPTVPRGGNNAGRSVGRYARRMEAMTGTLQGSLQASMKEQQLASQLGQAPYKSRLPESVRQFSNSNDIEKFDSDVTDFSKSLSTPVAAPAPAPARVKEEAKPIFTFQIGEKVHTAIREIKEGGINIWKPSETQRFHPAWCARTHTVRYFETTEGLVIVIAQELQENEKEIAMEYAAHAIDPTKGLPDVSIPRKPVREEAKVLYGKDVKSNINVVIADKTGMEEDISGCIRTARIAAEMSTPVPDAYIRKSIVTTPVVYDDNCAADDDKIVIAAIPVRIGSFEEDATDLIKVVEETQGALYGEILRTKQSVILLSNVSVASAMDMKAHANAVLTVDDQEELSEEKLKMILFLSYNVMSTWVKFTDDEMAIGVPDKGAAQIQENTYAALYEITKMVFDQVTEKDIFTEFHIVTKDNVRYRLHRSLINKNCFLISKQAKDTV